MKIKYFTNVTTAEDVKKQYRKLAKQHHPDLNKDDAKEATEAMKQINKEYEYIISNSQFFTSDHDKKDKHKVNPNDLKMYRDIINELIIHDDVIIELVGSWLWISGNTYPIRKKLNTLQFRFSKNKKSWYYFEGIKDQPRKRGRYTLEQLKQRHDTKKIDNKPLKPLLT